MEFEKIINKYTGEKAISFFARNYDDYRSKEAEITKLFPTAIKVKYPCIGYEGEYWYNIGG